MALINLSNSVVQEVGCARTSFPTNIAPAWILSLPAIRAHHHTTEWERFFRILSFSRSSHDYKGMHCWLFLFSDRGPGFTIRRKSNCMPTRQPRIEPLLADRYQISDCSDSYTEPLFFQAQRNIQMLSCLWINGTSQRTDLKLRELRIGSFWTTIKIMQGFGVRGSWPTLHQSALVRTRFASDLNTPPHYAS